MMILPFLDCSLASYFRKAATLGACPSVWFRLGCSCLSFGDAVGAEDAFAKVTAMDNTHALVWAELAKLSLRASPPRLGDARQYVPFRSVPFCSVPLRSARPS